MRLLLALCLAIPTLAAAQAPATRDSAGITIVINARPSWKPAQQWTVDAQPLADIGRAEGEDAYLFSSIFQATGVGANRTAIVDYRAADIRLFDGAKYLRTVGKRGKGPGEFNAAPTITYVPPDTIVAYDPSQRRLSWFNIDGKLIREHSFLATPAAEVLPMAMVWDAWRLFPDGTIVTTSALMSRPVAGAWKRPRAVRVVSPDNTTASLGEFALTEGFREGRMSAGNPFAPRAAATVDPKSRMVVISHPTTWEIAEYDVAGKLRRITRAPIAQPRVTSAMVDAEKAKLTNAKGLNPQDLADLQRAFGALSFPEVAPAIGDLFDDGAGNLWVARWSPDTNRRSKDYTYVFDILNAQRKWLGTVRLPPALGDVVGIEGDRMFVVWSDDMEVQHVRVHRIRKPR